jgi:hypothetical protein
VTQNQEKPLPDKISDRTKTAMKGVEGCEKLGEAVKQALIPRFPNDRAPNP